MSARRARLALPLAVLLLGGLAIAQQAQPPGAASPPPPPQDGTAQSPPAAPPQQPTFRTGVNFVRVDVIVTDAKGNPILDLKQSDFEVTEDGKAQTVESFKLVRISETEQPGTVPREIRTAFDEESEAQRDDVRLIAVFLDDYHVRRGASMGVRDPLIRFIQTQLAPADMIGVAYPLTPVSDIQLTRNHGAVVGAIERFEGRKFDYTPRNQFEDRYAHYPTHIVEKVRNQVSLSGLKAIITHLGGLREGRKTVIVVTEGFTDLLPPQMRDSNAQFPGLNNPNRQNPMAGQDDRMEDTMRFFESMDLLEDLRSVYAAANRSNTSLYTLDPRGLGAFEFDINENVGLKIDQSYLRSTQDTLRILAENTDGRAIVNRNDLDEGLKQVVRDSSGYYLVGYNSTQAPSDGKFHEIKVRVKRPGLQVRARKGYWALTAEETARAAEPPKPGPAPGIGEALARVTRTSREKLVRTWIGIGRGESGKARITFAWEPASAVPGVSQEQPARVSLTALGADGAPQFRGRVPDVALVSTSPDAAGASDGSVARSGAVVVFDGAPGPVQMRVSIEGARGQVLDTVMQEIVVPDFTAPQVSMSTPAIFRARNALELRSLQQESRAVPIAGRDFRRTDRLLIRFEAYGPGGVQPVVTAKLLNRGGQPMSDVPVTASPVAGGSQIDLPLASLAAGEYLVEIVAKTPEGEAKELVGFRVTS